MTVRYSIVLGDIAVVVEGEAAESTWALFQEALDLVKPKKTLAEAARPANVVNLDPAVGQARDKEKALAILTDCYNVPELREKTRELLGVFSVKRFSDVPLERAGELLQLALALREQHP